MTPEIILLFAVVWCGFFGGVAAFGYWRNNYTNNRRKHCLITTILVIGGMISLMIGNSLKLRHHHAGAKT